MADQYLKKVHEVANVYSVNMCVNMYVRVYSVNKYIKLNMKAPSVSVPSVKSFE